MAAAPALTEVLHQASLEGRRRLGAHQPSLDEEVGAVGEQHVEISGTSPLVRLTVAVLKALVLLQKLDSMLDLCVTLILAYCYGRFSLRWYKLEKQLIESRA